MIADRLAFGAAAAPYEALADFSRRLGDSPDPSALLPAVADAAAHAVNASRASVVLHVDAGPDRRAVWPRSGERPGAGVRRGARRRPGRAAGQHHGRCPPDALRPEQRLLADLADQAGMAFRDAASRPAPDRWSSSASEPASSTESVGG